MTTPAVARRRPRRAGRNRDDVLAAAAKVVAERGVDQTRFADVSAEAGVPISTLQYYFGSREDLLIAVFDHAWRSEREWLSTQLTAIEDPWQRISLLVSAGLEGFSGSDDVRGRLWLEAVRLGIRDPEARPDVLGDYEGWRAMLADAIRGGIESGAFSTPVSPDDLAVVALSLVDGMGMPIALGDPRLDKAAAETLVLRALALLLGTSP
jgi:AcrR family transcriptional regulator